MKWRLFLLTSALLFVPLSANALTVMVINTEFLWDHREPHEGRIVGNKKPAPTKEQYTAKLTYFAKLIKQHHADIVALTEIEGCHISNELSNKLGQGWSSLCQKGRDTFTGQDVAIVTTLSPGPVTNFKEHYSYVGDKKIRPSKVLGAVLSDGNIYYQVTVAHLISKRGNNDAKRLAQATAIRSGIASMASQFPFHHEILMGDMNDTPGSPTLERLKNGVLLNTSTPNVCSYTYRNLCSLIDHILISPSLAGGTLYDVEMDDNFSDHRAIVYTF